MTPAQQQSELDAIVALVQKFQPGGSPPPGGPYLLTAWVLRSLKERGDQSEQLQKDVTLLWNALKRLSKVLNGNLPADNPEFPTNGAIHALLEADDALKTVRERLEIKNDPFQEERAAGLKDPRPGPASTFSK